MCRPGTLAALVLVAVAAGCFGGSGASHRTLTAGKAVRQARADGFTDVRRSAGLSWHCRPGALDAGPTSTAGQGGSYGRSSYSLTFGDRRLPTVDDNTAQIAMYVAVFPDAAFAARCARAGLFQADHVAVQPGLPATRVIPHRAFGPTTIVTHMHRLRRSLYPNDGDYQTYLARGRVLALGLASTRSASRIVQADLARLATQIAG
jgi:hypothetical protein